MQAKHPHWQKGSAHRFETNCWPRSSAWNTTTTMCMFGKVILWTYHKLLVSTSQKPLASVFKRLQHLLLRLQQYDCEILYKPGKEMLLADTLSRAYSEDYERSASKSEVECINATHFLPVPDHQLNELQRETACDPALQFVKKGILGGFPDTKDEQPAAIHQYRTSLNNSLGQFISFFAQKGGNYSREGDYLREKIISNIAHWKSCPKYFVLFFH